MESPDILLPGSSHLEGINVLQSETTAALSVYSIGMSGHDLPELGHFLPATLSLFEPAPRYIVLEIRSLALSWADLDYIYEQVESQPGWLCNLPLFCALEQ